MTPRDRYREWYERLKADPAAYAARLAYNKRHPAKLTRKQREEARAAARAATAPQKTKRQLQAERVKSAFKAGHVRDLRGQVFGRLWVTKPAFVDAHRVMHWHCVCECGRKYRVSGKSLRLCITVECASCASFRWRHGYVPDQELAAE